MILAQEGRYYIIIYEMYITVNVGLQKITKSLIRRNNSQHTTHFTWRVGKKKLATCCVIIIPTPLRIAALNNLRGVIDNIVSHGSPEISSTCCVLGVPASFATSRATEYKSNFSKRVTRPAPEYLTLDTVIFMRQDFSFPSKFQLLLVRDERASRV